MDNAPQMPNAIKWGAIMGVLLIIMSLLFYLTGAMDPETGQSGALSTVLSYVISIGALVLGIKAYKTLNNGTLSIGQGIVQGLLIALVGGLISAIYTYIFFAVLEPDILENMKEMALDQSGANSEDVEGIMDAFMSPGVMAVTIVIMKLFLGLIVGLICGLAMRSVDQARNDVL